MTATTQDKFSDIKSRLADMFEIREASLNGNRNHPIHGFRNKAMDRLMTLDFPTRRNEDWKYTSISRIFKPEYSNAFESELDPSKMHSYLPKDMEGVRLVFVNGIFSDSLSSSTRDLPEGLTVLSIPAALDREDLRPMVERQLTQIAGEENNPFTVLNLSFAKPGYFIHVAANIQVEKPVFLLNVTVPCGASQLINAHNIICLEKNSRLEIIESYEVADENEHPCFTNIVNRLALDRNAQLTHYKVQRESLNSFLISNSEVTQQRDSIYTHYSVDLGGRLVRNNLSALLEDTNTTTHLFGAYMAKSNQHIDNQTFVDHAHPHCYSNELYKGILTDKANGVFNGKVMVRPDAQKTNAFQQNASLVLSPRAVMDSKPQLEIFADDVKCSHGATIGQLDDKAIYYLRSRGLTDARARALLQQAFLFEVLEKIKNESVQKWIEDMVYKKFSQ